MISKVFGMVLAASVAVFASSCTVEAAAKKKRTYTEAQKKEIRKKAREWCIAKLVRGGNARFDRVIIKSDGSVFCRYYS